MAMGSCIQAKAWKFSKRNYTRTVDTASNVGRNVQSQGRPCLASTPGKGRLAMSCSARTSYLGSGGDRCGVAGGRLSMGVLKGFNGSWKLLGGNKEPAPSSASASGSVWRSATLALAMVSPKLPVLARLCGEKAPAPSPATGVHAVQVGLHSMDRFDAFPSAQRSQCGWK